MKKYVLKSSLCAGLAALLLTLAPVKGSLKDITKPYLGAYECKSATLGDKEYLDDFSYIRLELKADESFSLYYAFKGGEKKEETGRYKYDGENKSVTLIGKGLGNREFKKSFPLDNGKIFITLSVGGKMLIMEFEQP